MVALKPVYNLLVQEVGSCCDQAIRVIEHLSVRRTKLLTLHDDFLKRWVVVSIQRQLWVCVAVLRSSVPR